MTRIQHHMSVGRGAIVAALLAMTVSAGVHGGADDTCGATQGPVRFSGVIQGGDVLPPLAEVEAIASGWYHGVAILGDGSLAFWGDDSFGQCSPPEGVGSGEQRVVGVAGGQFHTIALLADGSVVAWGGNDDGQLDVPDGLVQPGNPVIQVDAGNRYSAALRADGSVLQWGDQVCDETPADDNNNPITRINCGANATSAVRADGAWEILCSDFLPESPEPITITDVVLFGVDEGNYVVALSADGDLFSVSPNGEWFVISTPDSPIVQVRGCATIMATLQEDGSAHVVDTSQLGLIDPEAFVDATDLRNGLSSRRSIELGAYHLVTLVDEGDCDGSGVSDAEEIADGTVADCDDNGIPDSCDIALGAEDSNGNGVPDACEFAEGDLNLDGCVDGADLGIFLTAWSVPDSPVGDFDGNGVIDGADLGLLLLNWGCG
ncbi:MAG: hypothetical protein MK085_02220 [Phycisphaerales bacterium]|nr:hypothetical protein [Phycisphaerales bacterium]